ncbi:protein kinase (plasmid) [Streptomyces sp. NBC_01724]|uniref:serine/threonine-protein kinase n=1 Tax=Streptomyces sp. NBC_01724 TaxID=2975922 RepID=UPI002E38049F|nr:protein kinase [Streptomyces sp. NBC_01724]
MAGTEGAADRVIAGRYRLLRKLGAGGMGRVWLAHDQELTSDVALKEIAVPPEMPEHELNSRIARARGEARHSARLRSNPHVVTVYDIVVDGGLPWIVMEFVPGEKDLEAVVRESGPLSPPDTAKLGLAVLDALTEGHGLGILHRDVKPSNILLADPDPQGCHLKGIGRVLLTDYGISLQQDSGEPRQTSASQVIGTPLFLAPERAQGSPPTAASDLYSLGATLYFAVEGHAPFDRDSDLSTLSALLLEEPPPPCRAGTLAPVLLGLLARDPEQRLSGDAAADQLAQLVTAPPAEPVLPTHEPTVRVSPHSQTRTQTSSQPVAPERRPSSEPRRSWIHGLRWSPRSGPGARGAPGRRPSRKARWVIASAGAALLLAGGVVWATLAQHRPSARSSTPSGAVMPYGDSVGLTRALHPGDCVSAVWASEKFKVLPNLKTVNCMNSLHDGQVIKTEGARSLDNVQENGHNRCAFLVKDTVSAMADAQAYALTPNQQGWDNGVHNIACLVFNKTLQITGNVGTFRQFGEPIDLTNASVGDCYKNKTTSDGTLSTLAKCDTPHDDQSLGFIKVPPGMTFKAVNENMNSMCTNKYGSAYVSPTHYVAGWTVLEDDWKQGFRYVQCTLEPAEGKKLNSDLVRFHQPT